MTRTSPTSADRIAVFGVPPARLTTAGGMAPSLYASLAQALTLADGRKTVDLLRNDPGGFSTRLWLARYAGADHVEITAAFERPFATLTRKVDGGGVRTVPGLITLLRQILAVDGKKSASRSFKRANPRAGYGRRLASGGRDQPLFVSSTAVVSDPSGREPRPDERATAAEIPALVQAATVALDPLHVKVYWAVQEHRLVHGKSGAYPAVARRLITDPSGTPVALRRPDEDVPPAAPKPAVNWVRKVFLAVRGAIATRLTAEGYAVPEDRPRRRRR